MSQAKKIMLTGELLEQIVQMATKTAIETYKAEEEHRKKARRDARYHNTKLLLKNYRSLKDYSENTIYDVVEIGAKDDEEMLLNLVRFFDDTREVKSIKDRLVFTRVAMENVDRALEAYKTWCVSSNKPDIQRRWDEVYHLYLCDAANAKTAEEIALANGIAPRTVYDDIDKITKDMEKRFFGLDLDFFENS